MPIARIDTSLCTGCGKCVDTCPEDVIRLNTAPSGIERLSPCATGCPAQVNVRKYSYYIEMDMMEEAAAELAEMLPFPAITGRVCPHSCESKCARAEVDDAVNINALERYIGDYILKQRLAPVKKIYSGRVAVVGSGPAGVSCAYFLCRRGYSVTVFEKLPVAGGVMRVGIPAYKLPRELVDDQIKLIADMGVEFKTGVTVGRDISLDELRKEFDAVFVASGLPLSRKTAVEGDGLAGVLYGMEFLCKVGLGGNPTVGKRVAVIGGGNVAVNTALTASRLGAEKVHIFSLEDEPSMPAFVDEIKQAREEGVIIHPSTAARRILGADGNVCGIEVMKCLRTIDESGAFNPVYDQSDSISFDVDTVIFSIGQASDASLIPEKIQTNKGGMIKADSTTLETDIPGVFAGGDITGLPNQSGTVVKALASGKRAAESIDRYLRGESLTTKRDICDRVQNPPKDGILPFPRQQTKQIPVCERKGNFSETTGCFSENEARLEAQRCMTCGSKANITYPEDCMVCLYCERDCPAQAIYVSPDRVARRLGPWDLDG